MLSITVWCLFLLGVGCLNCKNKISYIGSFIISLSISIPALYFIPTSYDDLSRYFQEMNIVNKYDTIHSLIVIYHELPILFGHSSNYIYIVFQWLISRSGNYALLPFLSVLIVYFCISLPMVHQRIVHKCSFTTFLLGIMLVVSLFQYKAVISTIRWNLASAIFFLISYMSFNCKFNKLYTLPLYLIPLFIHQGMIVPVSIVIICIVFNNTRIRWYMYIIYVFILVLFFYVLSNTNSSNKLVQHFQFYNSANIFKFFGNSGFVTLLSVLASIIPFIYIFLSFILIKDNKKINYNLEINMSILFIIIDFSLFFDLTIANRYIINIGLCSVLIYLKTIKYKGVIRPSIRYIFITVSFLVIFLMILYVILRMHFNFNQVNFGGLYYINE